MQNTYILGVMTFFGLNIKATLFLKIMWKCDVMILQRYTKDKSIHLQLIVNLRERESQLMCRFKITNSFNEEILSQQGAITNVHCVADCWNNFFSSQFFFLLHHMILKQATLPLSSIWMCLVFAVFCVSSVLKWLPYIWKMPHQLYCCLSNPFEFQ